MSLVLVEWAKTETDVLVNVYGDGKRLGSLAFPKAVWAVIQERGKVELFVGHKEESVVVDL